MGTTVTARGPAGASPPRAAAPPGGHVAPRTLEELSLQALLELSQEIHATDGLYRVAELGLLKFMGNLGTASAALWVIPRQSGRPILLRIDPTLPSALCDPGHLRRILDELVGNAVKFSPEGSRVTLRALCDRRDCATMVRLEVEDNGPGIPPERLARAFEPFEQLDGSRTRAAGGMGLGLPLARELARKLGGDLEVRDLSGRGTVCTLWLRSDDDAPIQAA